MMNNLIRDLQDLFDMAWEINNSGNGTDLSRKVTTVVPNALQDIQAKRPERHGRWVFDAFTAKVGVPYRCSICKEEYNDTYNYCPNCGVKMDVTDINVGNKGGDSDAT